MIDFVKYELINTYPEQLELNSYLEFHNRVNTETGELGKYLSAFYKGLEFKIFEPTKANSFRRITVEGSLHKYWNNGSHNFNDFGITQIWEVVLELKFKFNLLQENCVLKQLEIGVNITPPYKSKTILNYCLLHKTDRLKWIYTKDEGSYIQAKHQRHIIKIYDKKSHYTKRGFEIGKEILRFEIKYVKMKYLNDKSIYSMKDLLNYGLIHFVHDLLKEWDNILFYDNIVFNSTKYKHIYSNPNYWLSLNYELFKYHRNNLKKLTKKNPSNIKKTMRNLIQEKAKFLNTKTTEINPLHIRLKTVVSTFENENKNRQFFSVIN